MAAHTLRLFNILLLLALFGMQFLAVTVQRDHPAEHLDHLCLCGGRQLLRNGTRRLGRRLQQDADLNQFMSCERLVRLADERVGDPALACLKEWF